MPRSEGFGLWSVADRVRAAAGEITVDTAPGRGTTFKIYLPRVQEEVQPDKTPADRPTIATGTETILLAEDEEGVRTFARYVLEKAGYKVLEARHGEDGASGIPRPAEGRPGGEQRG